MRTAILCDPLNIDNIYDLLVCPTSGCEVLSGSKVCIDEHLSIPNLMEFELNEKEFNAVKKLSGVTGAFVQFGKPAHFYTVTNQNGIPKYATTQVFTGSSTQIPHSLYYCQNYSTSNINDNLYGMTYSLSSIDCSNVDILILDSGVDSTNPEFTDQTGQSTYVTFNWTQLKEGDPITGTQIVAVQPLNYNNDTNGHGTACASLVAGKRCGFAKNAKIYNLRSNELGSTTDGFTITECLKLALAFQKAKNNNLFGLLSSRPTVFTNSWGYDYRQFKIHDSFDGTANIRNWSSSLGYGLSSSIHALPAMNTSADSYFREIVQNGAHILHAAGNSNAYLDHTNTNDLTLHLWRSGLSFNEPGFTLRTVENSNSYTYDSNFTQNNQVLKYGYEGFTYITTPAMYSSPNIGWNGIDNYTKQQYPIITVGDITQVGHLGPDDKIYIDSYPKSVFTILSANNDFRIRLDNSTRYSSKTGPYFVKSDYSNFGPSVDIYAPGRGCWAAYSNQTSSPPPFPVLIEPVISFTPYIKLSDTQKYFYFNGTSAACPVVAGILATYLSEFPSATPLQARNWLLTTAVSGNIMETRASFLPVSSYSYFSTTETFSAAQGYNISQFRFNVYDRYYNRINHFLAPIGESSPFYRQLNLDEVLLGTRFFDSNNLIPQAYPLRRVIISSDFNNLQEAVSIYNTTLVRSSSASTLAPTINNSAIQSYSFGERRRVTSFADLTPGIPPQPTITSITVGNQNMQVYFEAGLNRGLPVINYQYSLDSGSSWFSFSPPQTTSPLVITGLTNGTTYSVRIRPVNAVGPGTASNVVAATPGLFTIRVLGGGGGGGSGYCTATGGNGGHGGMVISSRGLPTGSSYSIGIGGGGAAAQSSGSRYNYGVDGGAGTGSYFGSINGYGGSGGLRANSYARSADGSTGGTIEGDTITIGPFNGYGQGGIGGTQNNNCEYSNSAQSGGTQGIVIVTYFGPQRATGGSYSYDGTVSTHTYTGAGTFTVTN